MLGNVLAVPNFDPLKEWLKARLCFWGPSGANLLAFANTASFEVDGALSAKFIVYPDVFESLERCCVADNTDRWLQRAEELLGDGSRRRSDVVPFAVSLLTAVYGPQSTQLESLNTTFDQVMKQKDSFSMKEIHRERIARHVVENTIAEIKSGLIVRIRTQVAGEVLGDLLSLAKEQLDDGSDSAKNVAAVMVAAAYEDLIRRLGREFGGVVDRPKLESVVTALKEAGILQGASVSIAQSFLPFRNHSLHADWDKLDRPQIQSAISFVEGLLAKHFS